MIDFTTLITDRTAEDVKARNAKGTYNATDLNRVQEAVQEIRETLVEYGYSVMAAAFTVWAVNDLPRANAMRVLMDSILELRDKLVYQTAPVELPPSMARLDYIGANNIEKFLADFHAALERVSTAWVFSGETYGGEIE